MKTDIKKMVKNIAQAVAEWNMEKDTYDINISKEQFKDYLRYQSILKIKDDSINSIEITRGIIAVNFHSDEDIKEAKKLCYEYLKDKNSDLNYDDIAKISLTSVEFELDEPIQYFLVGLLKNGKTISMKWCLSDDQIESLKKLIPNTFELIEKDSNEKRLKFIINKAINIEYNTDIISFVDINSLDSNINYKRDDYEKLKQITICNKKPDSDWRDLDQKKYWWDLCHKTKDGRPRELAEKFWGTYFVMVNDYGLYLIWINIENGIYHLVEINGVSNNEIPESLVEEVTKTIEKENKKIQTS